MEPPDERSVVEHLQRDAYSPILGAPQEERLGLAGLIWPALGRRDVVGRELVAFTRQPPALLESGLSPDRALGIQGELTRNQRLRAITVDILRSVRGGSSLGEALDKRHPRPFPLLYINREVGVSHQERRS